MKRLTKNDHIIISNNLKLARSYAQKALWHIVDKPGRRQRIMDRLEKILEGTNKVSTELIDRRDPHVFSAQELEKLYFDIPKPLTNDYRNLGHTGGEVNHFPTTQGVEGRKKYEPKHRRTTMPDQIQLDLFENLTDADVLFAVEKLDQRKNKGENFKTYDRNANGHTIKPVRTFPFLPAIIRTNR